MKYKTSHLVQATLWLAWGAASILVICAPVLADFQYKINSSASAALAVQQFGEDPTKFEYCVYQALVDNDEWRLVVASHDVLKSDPRDPNRECCFVESLAAALAPVAWPRPAGSSLPSGGPIPPDVEASLYDTFQREAYSDIKDAAAKLPNSFEAHLAYADLIKFNITPDSQQIQTEVEQYRRAEELRPRSSIVHHRLANAYWTALNPPHLSSYPAPVVHIVDPPKITMQLVIQEDLTAVRLDPALSECYLEIAFDYGQSDVNNYPLAAIYLRKYIDANPKVILPKFVTDYKSIIEKKIGHPV